MGPLKSPSPDGLRACFYQKFLKVVGGDICTAVLKILSGDGMIPSLNSTSIAYIPKKCNPNFVNEYQPIILCNVVYKLVSKVLTNRLKPHMHSLISKNQSA